MESLVHISGQKRELTKKLRQVLDMGMSLEMPKDRAWIAQFQVRPNLLEEIKAVQDKDHSLIKLKEEVIAGHTIEFRVYDGVLK